MTNEKLKQARELVEKATKDELIYAMYSKKRIGIGVKGQNEAFIFVTPKYGDLTQDDINDVALMVKANYIVPQLLDEVEWLQKQNEKFIKWFRNYHLTNCGAAECGECTITDCYIRELGLIAYGYEVEGE